MIENILYSLKILGLYIIPCVLVLLVIRFLFKPKQYIFRKLLHMVAFSCVTVMIYLSADPFAAALACMVATAILYPLLSFLERYSWFQNLLVEKRAGEIRSSYVQLLVTIAALIIISWGIFHSKPTAIASVQMWGIGDGMAALVGIPYGKHKLQGRFSDHRKSLEGSAAMLISSCLMGIILFSMIARLPFSQALLLAFSGALFGTVAEALSKNGYDTVSVPLCIMTVLLSVKMLMHI